MEQRAEKRLKRRRIKSMDKAMPKKKDSNKDWYKVESASGVFYSPSSPADSRYEYVGEGTKDPTPKELAEYLNNGDRTLHQSGKLVVHHFQDEAARKRVKLPDGCYVYKTSMDDEMLVPFDLRHDSFVTLGDVFASVVKDIDRFRNNEEVYRSLGTIYKMGQLLYGVPGCGKTALIRQILQSLNKSDTVIIFIEKEFPSDPFLIRLKSSLEDRLKVFVFEELAVDLSEWFVGKLLTFLDGELSLDRSITLATTNYPEKLPANLANRPSRFDKIYEFGLPKAEDRKLLFKHYLKRDITPEEVTKSKDLTIADIKEASLLVHIDSLDLSEAIKRMKDRNALCNKAFAKSREMVGFGNKWTGMDD